MKLEEAYRVNFKSKNDDRGDYQFMKILSHWKAERTRAVYCKKFLSFCGIDFYFSENTIENTREYFCHLKGTVDLLRWIGIDCNSTVEQAADCICGFSEEKIISLCTVEGELKRIEDECERGEWMREEEIDFCELVGNYELAKRARKNRDKWERNGRRVRRKHDNT